jgi:hypothetical protein
LGWVAGQVPQDPGQGRDIGRRLRPGGVDSDPALAKAAQDRRPRFVDEDVLGAEISVGDADVVEVGKSGGGGHDHAGAIRRGRSGADERHAQRRAVVTEQLHHARVSGGGKDRRDVPEAVGLSRRLGPPAELARVVVNLEDHRRSPSPKAQSQATCAS